MVSRMGKGLGPHPRTGQSETGGAECHGNAPGREEDAPWPFRVTAAGGRGCKSSSVAERKQEKEVLLLTPAHHGLVLFG